MKNLCILKKEPSFVKTCRYFFVFSALLVFGGIAGVFTASCLNLTSKQALVSDVTGYLSYGSTVSMSYFQNLWQISRIPICVFLLSFTCFGVVGVPALLFLQGYLLSFSVSVMVRFFGSSGLLLGIAAFGIQTIILVPCLLLLAVQAFRLSQRLFCVSFLKQKYETGSLFPKGFILAAAIALLLLLIGSVLDYLLTERLVEFIASSILI